MPPTNQQRALIDHDPSGHGRVLAGPGTGKSWTAIAMLQRLAETRPEVPVRLLTFTRAATAELAKKFGAVGLPGPPPTTIHSFALSLLLGSPNEAGLPLPLRIPDSWEAGLIRSHLAAGLRSRGFSIDKRKVEKLEREMSARWEALDDSIQLLADVDPELRSAYVGAWGSHRRLFGYSLLAELPYRAGVMIEDYEPVLEPIGLLVVDEYQDLNEADIRLIRLLAARSVSILAIGDDDQSIYGFRMAAPAGIRRFPTEFGGNDYPLTVSHRCGANILAAANALIQAAPDRARKQALTPRDPSKRGDYYYARFSTNGTEAAGVADIIEARIAAGVAPSEIAVLVRSQLDVWSNALIPVLEKKGIAAVNLEWVEEALKDPGMRRRIALMRLAVWPGDSLAWWSLIQLGKGIANSVISYVCAEAGAGESFADALLRLHPDYPGAPTEASGRAVARLVSEILSIVGPMQHEGASLDEFGWGGWVLNTLDSSELSEPAKRLLLEVGPLVPAELGLSHFLGQLEPLGRDIATASDAVRIMTMTTSKGLTVNTCIVMGVERGIVPHPKVDDIEEERRLLYVAMTRATDVAVLTFATRRTGPTARHGSPNVNRPRGRSPLLDGLPCGQWSPGSEVVEQIRNAGELVG